MGFSRDLLTGFAGILQTAGAGTYRSDNSAYQAGETAITFGGTLDQPDRCITLTGYGAGFDAPREALTRTNLQTISRGARDSYLDAEDLDDAVFQAIQGLTGRQFGSVYLIQCLRRSSIPLGPDAAMRWEISSNYALDINPPTTSLRPE